MRKNLKNVKVVILCGGLGTRLSEETKLTSPNLFVSVKLSLSFEAKSLDSALLNSGQMPSLSFFAGSDESPGLNSTIFTSIALVNEALADCSSSLETTGIVAGALAQEVTKTENSINLIMFFMSIIKTFFIKFINSQV